MLEEGVPALLASGRAADSLRAAVLSLGDDLAGLGAKQGLDSLTRVTSTHTATNVLIPCKTLGMANFSLGLGFPNCTIDLGTPTVSSPGPPLAEAAGWASGEKRTGRSQRTPPLFTAARASGLRRSFPKGALWSAGQAPGGPGKAPPSQLGGGA